MAYKLDQRSDKFHGAIDAAKDVMGSCPNVVLEDKGLDLEINDDQRTIEVVVSSDRQDREGDIILQEGIDHSFAKSVLYAHDYGRKNLPIAKILESKVRVVGTKDSNKNFKVTVEKHQFPETGQYDLSDVVWNLVNFGALTSTSIGFIAKKITVPVSDEEREEMGVGPMGVVFNKIEKLETSWTPVQSNRDAIREAYGKKLFSGEQGSLIFPKWDEIKKPDYWMVDIDLTGGKEKKEGHSEDQAGIVDPGVSSDEMKELIGGLEEKTGEIQGQIDTINKSIKDLVFGFSEMRKDFEGNKPKNIDQEELEETLTQLTQNQDETIDLEEVGVILTTKVTEIIAQTALDVLNKRFGRVDRSKLQFKERRTS